MLCRERISRGDRSRHIDSRVCISAAPTSSYVTHQPPSYVVQATVRQGRAIPDHWPLLWCLQCLPELGASYMRGTKCAGRAELASFTETHTVHGRRVHFTSVYGKNLVFRSEHSSLFKLLKLWMRSSLEQKTRTLAPRLHWKWDFLPLYFITTFNTVSDGWYDHLDLELISSSSHPLLRSLCSFWRMADLCCVAHPSLTSLQPYSVLR